MADQELRELFEERAAIMEFEGNLSREEAERLAREDVERVKAKQWEMFT